MKRYILGGLAAAAIGLFAAQASQAAPVSTGLKGADAGLAPSMIEKTHGCHRTRALGPGGWHRHVGPLCRRVATPPPRHWRRRM